MKWNVILIAQSKYQNDSQSAGITAEMRLENTTNRDIPSPWTSRPRVFLKRK